MIGRLTVVLAVFAAAAGLARAEPAETLTVLRDCPAKGWHRACLPIDFFFTEDGSGRLRTKHIDDGSWNGTDVLDHILVKGSLLEGRGQGVFRLKLDYTISENESDSPNELGAFAFVGHSRNGRPIVLTDRGPLEIVTPGLIFDKPAELFVVREKTGRVIAQLAGADGMPFVATKAGEIGVWDSKRAICIAAPTVRTKELAIITTACKGAGVPEDGVVLGGNVEISDVNMADARRMIGISDSADFSVHRVPGAGLLLIWVSWQYCC